MVGQSVFSWPTQKNLNAPRMKAYVLCMLVAGAAAMPYGGWEGGSVSVAHAPVAYAQPIVKQVVQPQYVHAAPVTYTQPIVKQVVQPQYVHAAPVHYAQPIVKQVVQPQYVHAAPVVKAIAPAASSYSTFSQTHVSHPQIVKVAQPVAYAQPVVKVAQPVAYAQPVSHGWSQPLSHGW